MKNSLPVGTEIYYGGDMANDSGFGIVFAVTSDRWGQSMELHMKDGRKMHISPACFSDNYSGNGSTRFVTREAYEQYRRERIAAMESRIAAMETK
jgi:hypothetical protein